MLRLTQDAMVSLSELVRSSTAFVSCDSEVMGEGGGNEGDVLLELFTKDLPVGVAEVEIVTGGG